MNIRASQMLFEIIKVYYLEYDARISSLVFQQRYYFLAELEMLLSTLLVNFELVEHPLSRLSLLGLKRNRKKLERNRSLSMQTYKQYSYPY